VISATPVGHSIPARSLDWLKAYAEKTGRPLVFYQRIEERGVLTGLKRFGFGPADFQQQVAQIDIAESDSSLAMQLG
jgi:hypothetical protein